MNMEEWLLVYHNSIHEFKFLYDRGKKIIMLRLSHSSSAHSMSLLG
jgi:hypothetical protein